MRNKLKGFSLAELLLAIFILSIVGLLIMGLFTAGIDHYRRLDVTTTAGALANQKMEELMAIDIDQVQADSAAFSAPFTEYQYNVDITPGPNGVKEIELTVSGPKGVTRRLKSLRAPQDIPEGMRVYLKYDCWTCHNNDAVPGGFANPVSPTGPNLTNPGIALTAANRIAADPVLATAVELATGGTTPKDYIRFSVRQPQAYLVSGYGGDMPSFDANTLPDSELTALADWLGTLDQP